MAKGKRLQRPQVVLVSRCFVRKNGKLLLIRRSAKERHNPRKWECPGGKLDQGQDLRHALEREVLEETGLLVEPAHQLFTIDSYVIGDGQYLGLTYVVVFGVAQVIGGRFELSSEHSDHRWISLKKLMSLDLTPETRRAAIALHAYITE